MENNRNSVLINLKEELDKVPDKNEKLKIVNDLMSYLKILSKRTKLYLGNGQLRTYMAEEGKTNPCGCGSNCFHYEFDGNWVIGVCNCCGKDIYTKKKPYDEEFLKEFK